MEIWNRVLQLTHTDPDNPEIQDLLHQLNELDKAEKGVLGISPLPTSQRRDR